MQNNIQDSQKIKTAYTKQVQTQTELQPNIMSSFFII